MRKIAVLLASVALIVGISGSASAKGVKPPKILNQITQSSAVTANPKTFYGDLFVEMWLGQVEPNTMLWGNVYFQEDGEEYPYGQGQLMSSDSRGWVHFIFPEKVVDPELEEGTLTLWVSDTYLGGAISLDDGSLAWTETTLP